MRSEIANALNYFLYKRSVLKSSVYLFFSQNIYLSEVLVLQQQYFFGRQLILFFLKHMYFKFLYLFALKLKLLILKVTKEKFYQNKTQIP